MNRCFLSEPHKGQTPFSFTDGVRQSQTWDAPLVYLGATGWSCPSSLSDPPRWETSPSTISVTARQNKNEEKGEKRESESSFYLEFWRNSRGRCGSRDTSCRWASPRGRSTSPSACTPAHTHTHSYIYTSILPSSTQSPQSDQPQPPTFASMLWQGTPSVYAVSGVIRVYSSQVWVHLRVCCWTYVVLTRKEALLEAQQLHMSHKRLLHPDALWQQGQHTHPPL